MTPFVQETLNGVIEGFAGTVALLISGALFAVTTLTPWSVDIALFTMSAFFAALSLATGAVSLWTLIGAWKLIRSN